MWPRAALLRVINPAVGQYVHTYAQCTGSTISTRMWTVQPQACNFLPLKGAKKFQKTVKKTATKMNQTQHPESRYSGDQYL